jgi:hypothetical protein
MYTEIPQEIRDLNDIHRIITNIDIENTLYYKLDHPLFKNKNIFEIVEEQSNIMEKPIIINLNLLTKENFEIIFNDVLKITNFLTEYGIEAFVKIIFMKIQSDTNFTEIYSNICEKISNLEYKINDTKNGLVINLLLEKINIKFNELLEIYNDDNKKNINNFMNFIGYLYNKNIIDTIFLNFLIKKIIIKNNYEILCNIIKITNKKLKQENTIYIKNYIDIILDSNKKQRIINMRIKFMLEDIKKLF